MAVKKDPTTLEQADPFVSLFPVEPETLELVKGSIREHGFQIDKPILVWKDAFGEQGRQVVVDGHTRLRAALDLKLPEVWATMRQFKDVDAAITAGIGEQVIRRNLNREQIAAYVVSLLPLLDETKAGLRTRTAKQLAKLLGVSMPTIDRARSLLDSGHDDLVEAVKQGEMSLLAAWQESLGDTPPPVPPARSDGPMTADEVVEAARTANAAAREAYAAELLAAETEPDEEDEQQKSEARARAVATDPDALRDGWAAAVARELRSIDGAMERLRTHARGVIVHLHDGTSIKLTGVRDGPHGIVAEGVDNGGEDHWVKLADLVETPGAVDLPEAPDGS